MGKAAFQVITLVWFFSLLSSNFLVFSFLFFVFINLASLLISVFLIIVFDGLFHDFGENIFNVRFENTFLSYLSFPMK